jgi:hypothetical protein
VVRFILLNGGVTVRSIKYIAFALLVAVVLSSCVISFDVETGDVYVAYYWDTANPITIISDNNTYLPSPFLNNQYYIAGPGTYQGRYKVGSDYYNYKYKLWVDFSDSALADLTDAYFQLWLSPSGPIFYDTTFDGNLKSIQKNDDSVATRAGESLVPVDTAIPPSGVTEVSRNGYHIQLEYWKSEE